MPPTGTSRPLLSPILAIFAFALAAAALIFPLPLGPAAMMMGILGALTAEGRRRWVRLAMLAVAAGLAGTAGGLIIGVAITRP